MLKLNKIGADDCFYDASWPPVNKAIAVNSFYDGELLEETLSELYLKDMEAYKTKVMSMLSKIYENYFGYENSNIITSNYNKDKELDLYKKKIILEKEFFQRIIKNKRKIEKKNCNSNQSACEYLDYFSFNNDGVSHEFFEFVERDMTRDQWMEFLMLEVVRNEIVDDEVALMVPGLQHAMKQVIASNLWDECGNGRISGFHTTWLRMLLDELDLWHNLKTYRISLPWFASLTSHSLTSLLTSFCGQYRAYGHFLITEGWVCSHFEKMINGMNRVGLTAPRIQIYFDHHINIDYHHTKEMIAGIRQMRPRLSSRGLREVIDGAHQAEAAGVIMYDNLLRYFDG